MMRDDCLPSCDQVRSEREFSSCLVRFLLHDAPDVLDVLGLSLRTPDRHSGAVSPADSCRREVQIVPVCESCEPCFVELLQHLLAVVLRPQRRGLVANDDKREAAWREEHKVLRMLHKVLELLRKAG